MDGGSLLWSRSWCAKQEYEYVRRECLYTFCLHYLLLRRSPSYIVFFLSFCDFKLSIRTETLCFTESILENQMRNIHKDSINLYVTLSFHDGSLLISSSFSGRRAG